VALRLRMIGAALSIGFLATPSQAPGAEFTVKDGQVLGRTLGYVGDGRSGVVLVGVVISPDNPAAQQEAERVLATIGQGLAAGRVKLQARPILVDQLAIARGLDALFVPSGSLERPRVMLAAERLHIPVVSTDMACVETAQCTVGFTSEPTVQIVISRSAADRTGVRFTQAFRMLVTER